MTKPKNLKSQILALMRGPKYRPLDQKESRRWIQTATAGKRVLGGAAMVTVVADREADLYPLWALVPQPGGSSFVEVYKRATATWSTLPVAASKVDVRGSHVAFLGAQTPRHQAPA